MSTAETLPSGARRLDALDDYNVDDFDQIFRDLTPPPETSNNDKKRKESDLDDLGLDEEVSVAKRQRVPAVKLDEERLLSEQGIPKLRQKARGLKFKGKGHEFSDVTRLLSFYQLWLDDLFPKAKFLDALVMVEKVGHKATMMRHRTEWIEEEKRKEFQSLELDSFDTGFTGENQLDDDEDIIDEIAAPILPTITHDIAERPRQKTPAELDPLDGADLYDTSPQRTQPTPPGMATEPEDDDLEALMREADESIQAAAPRKGDNPANGTAQPTPDDFADEEAAMAEMEGLW